MRPRSSWIFLPVFVVLASGPVRAQASLREALDVVDARWLGAAPITDGAVGGAARFDGERAHLDVGPCPVSSTQPFTLRCRLRTKTASFCTPLMARDGEAVGLSLVLGRSPGTVSFETWSWRTTRLTSRGRVDDGQWHAIEVTYDPQSNVAMMLVDGEVQGHAELGLGDARTAHLRLGDNIGAHQPFAGDLDEVEVLPQAMHLDALRAQAPVLPRGERVAALATLRARVLPKSTPSLAADVASDWPARRAVVRAHTADALGLSPAPARAPLDVQVHGELVRGAVRVQRISWIGFVGQRATGWLWTPVEAPTGRRPAILNPHGHWQDGAQNAVVQARCAAFAAFGWVALAVDSVHVEHVASGVNAVGAMTWHNQRALDLLLARDDVDPARIGCTGASGGGQQTYYLMALEERIAAAAPMVMACHLAEIVDDTTAHCGCNHVPRLAARTDVPEMCAVFAPKPVLFGSVSGDWTRNFPREGLPELVAHWAQQRGPTPRSRFANEEHNYDQPMREVVYGFFHDVLLAPASDGAPRARVAEPAFVPFPLGELRPLLVACPPVRLNAEGMAQEYLARRPRLASLAELAPGLDFDVQRRAITWRDGEDAAWRGGVVLADDGVPIPLRMGRPRAGAVAAFTVVIDPAGMAAARLGAAAIVDAVLVDPRPYGEWAPFRAAWQRNGIFLGRGEGYRAALDVALVCASLPGEGEVHVIGRGEAGVVALLAAHLCSRITTIEVPELGDSYASAGNRWPLCPELLRWRDLPELLRTLPPSCRRR